jgi:hypothetical protein
MASLLDARCTCAPFYRGLRPRPWCTQHERAAKIIADAEAYLQVMDDGAAVAAVEEAA